jgi:hypothetical protein
MKGRKKSAGTANITCKPNKWHVQLLFDGLTVRIARMKRGTKKDNYLGNNVLLSKRAFVIPKTMILSNH